MAQLKNVRLSIPEEHFELFDSVVDMQIASIKDDPQAISLLLVHGIQTDGAWHELVKEAFRDVGHVRVKGLGYRCVTALQLACPFRSGPINHIVDQFRSAREMEPTARIMVIAHSFGTYIISRILASCSDINIERIILCGSIIKSNYKWDIHTRHMAAGNIINDVGTRDFYPVLATFSTIGYGGTGRIGFKNVQINDRYFDYGHSDFFLPNNDHIVKYWKPYILDGEIVESKWDSLKPKTSLGVMVACHPWIGMPLFYGAIALLTVGVGALFW